MQDGKKLPIWEHAGLVVLSSRHSSAIGLIHNLNSGYISPQFHVVFDDWFETVTVDADRTPPEWEELVGYSRFQNVLDDEVDAPYLDDDWLDDTARNTRTAEEALRRQERERAAQLVKPANDAAIDQPPAPTVPPIPTPDVPEAPPNHVTWQPNQDVGIPSNQDVGIPSAPM